MPSEQLRAFCSSLVPTQTSLEYARELGCPTRSSCYHLQSFVKIAWVFTPQWVCFTPSPWAEVAAVSEGTQAGGYRCWVTQSGCCAAGKPSHAGG